jgi:hypothetical protein
MASKHGRHAEAPARRTYQDIEIAFLAGGLAEVERVLPRSRSRARESLWKAIEDLKARGKDARDLERLANDEFASKARGRIKPSVGETRVYRAQQLKAGAVFLRLPLVPIGIKKGGTAKVRFDSDRITIQRG